MSSAFYTKYSKAILASLLGIHKVPTQLMGQVLAPLPLAPCAAVRLGPSPLPLGVQMPLPAKMLHSLPTFMKGVENVISRKTSV